VAFFENYLNSLCKAQRRIVAEAGLSDVWVCKSGLWPEAAEPQAAVLKMHKRHWSPDPPEAVGNTTGIFFSVWMDKAAIAKGGLHYNLHALKLRQLSGYALESRKFAAAFRENAAPMLADWPEVETNFGPQTLFQGFVDCPAERVEVVTVELARKFVSIAEVVERLLTKAKKND
jgi:hypothetical protein